MARHYMATWPPQHLIVASAIYWRLTLVVYEKTCTDVQTGALAESMVDMQF